MTIIGKEIQVLDHGFIRVIDTMGDDSAVVQAARVSYGKGTKTVNEDSGLINYLMRHWHSTPFEMATIKLHIKLPIFVARQWMRHRTGSFNEVSARYSEVQECFYLPDIENIKSQSGTNKQGSGEPLETEHAKSIRNKFCVLGYDSHQDYKNFLASTVARETARIVLPLSTYTEFYWQVNLHNFMHFLRLRADSHAQYEIRVYAEALLELFKEWCPLTYAAFMEYRIGAVNVSRTGVGLIKQMLAGKKVGKPDTMSKNEWNDFQKMWVT